MLKNLEKLYGIFYTNLNGKIPNACKKMHIKLPKPEDMDSELAFYKLILWGWGLNAEAAKQALGYFANLPPLINLDAEMITISDMRIGVTHIAELSKTKKKRIEAWHYRHCSSKEPTCKEHYEKINNAIVTLFTDILNNALNGCKLLDDKIEGKIHIERLNTTINGALPYNAE